MTGPVHPIEARSYEILRSRVDTAGLAACTRAVVERVVHASADPDYLTDLVMDEVALCGAVEAVRAGVPVVADVEMVAAGITGRPVRCALRDAPVRTPAVPAGTGLTRSAGGVRAAYDVVGAGAIWVIGCAPTALAALLDLDARPALVVGLPVGFVGAVEAKARLREIGWPAVSNRSEKGGSAVAAAAYNALQRLAESGP